jgi:hypothetical protein
MMTVNNNMVILWFMTYNHKYMLQKKGQNRLNAESIPEGHSLQAICRVAKALK